MEKHPVFGLCIETDEPIHWSAQRLAVTWKKKAFRGEQGGPPKMVNHMASENKEWWEFWGHRVCPGWSWGGVPCCSYEPSVGIRRGNPQTAFPVFPDW